MSMSLFFDEKDWLHRKRFNFSCKELQCLADLFDIKIKGLNIIWVF